MKKDAYMTEKDGVTRYVYTTNPKDRINVRARPFNTESFDIVKRQAGADNAKNAQLAAKGYAGMTGKAGNPKKDQPKDDWRTRIKNAKASDADIETAFKEYKAGKYTPGPKTLALFKQMHPEAFAPAATPKETAPAPKQEFSNYSERKTISNPWFKLKLGSGYDKMSDEDFQRFMMNDDDAAVKVIDRYTRDPATREYYYNLAAGLANPSELKKRQNNINAALAQLSL